MAALRFRLPSGAACDDARNCCQQPPGPPNFSQPRLDTPQRQSRQPRRPSARDLARLKSLRFPDKSQFPWAAGHAYEQIFGRTGHQGAELAADCLPAGCPGVSSAKKSTEPTPQSILILVRQQQRGVKITHPANRCRIASSRAPTDACALSASTDVSSPNSKKRASLESRSMQLDKSM